MTPIAAYYVMIATEHELLAAPRHQVGAPRRSLIERIASGLEALLNLGRPSTVQPI